MTAALPRYESGLLYGPSGRRWWQFWRPATVACGQYWIVGNVITVSFRTAAGYYTTCQFIRGEDSKWTASKT
jgi:hypothetical protein